MSALALVEDLLGCALVVVGLRTAGDAVGCIGEGLLDLVLGGLGGVGSKLLLSLCESLLVFFQDFLHGLKKWKTHW